MLLFLALHVSGGLIWKCAQYNRQHDKILRKEGNPVEFYEQPFEFLRKSSCKILSFLQFFTYGSKVLLFSLEQKKEILVTLVQVDAVTGHDL